MAYVVSTKLGAAQVGPSAPPSPRPFLIGCIKPRERTGEMTGRRYEYQFEQTAMAALKLLSEGTHRCVFCDWHDDYVVHLVADDSDRYLFVQVKTKTSSQGPWTFRELFGVAPPSKAKKALEPKVLPEAVSAAVAKAKKPSAAKSPLPLANVPSLPSAATSPQGAAAPAPAATIELDETSPIVRMLAHHRLFGPACAGTDFLTNTGLHPDVATFMEALVGVTSPAALKGVALASFERIAGAYLSLSPRLAASSDELFHRLRSVKFHTDQGNLQDQAIAALIIGSMCSEYSEIALSLGEAQNIARDLISLVRNRATFTMTIVPVDESLLRQQKGVTLNDLLRVLSLSEEGHKNLSSAGGSDSVKTLSRLQRYCAKNLALAPAIEHICSYKAQWDVWRNNERHVVQSADYAFLEHRAKELLSARLPLDKLVEGAKEMAATFMRSQPAVSRVLTAEHALGLIFSIAAQGEAL